MVPLPAGETVAAFALRPLLVSPIAATADDDASPTPPPPASRLCLAPPSSPGGAVSVVACDTVTGAAVTFDVADAPAGGAPSLAGSLLAPTISTYVID